jgi:hypothetical protein
MLENVGNKKNIVVFVATNYEENAFTAISKLLIAHQLSMTTSGLATGTVNGCYGDSIVPHYALSLLLKKLSFQDELMPSGALLVGGVQCINHLFADPRLHEFLEWMVGLDKPVGICQPLPYELVISSKVARSDYVHLQNGESYAQFIEQFIKHVCAKHVHDDL